MLHNILQWGIVDFFVLARYKQDLRRQSLAERAYIAKISLLCTEDSHFIPLQIIFKIESKGEKKGSFLSWMLMLIVVVTNCT